MPVRIGKRRADRQLLSNDDGTENRAAENEVETALVEVEEDHSSNDDGCIPTPTNVGSTVVTYEYNLIVMPGVDTAKAVAQVDNHIPVRIAQELGIWCDEDGEEQDPMNRRALAAEGADGIYKLTPGAPDVIRTDGEFVFCLGPYMYGSRNLPPVCAIYCAVVGSFELKACNFLHFHFAHTHLFFRTDALFIFMSPFLRHAVQCESTTFMFDCVPVKASLGVQYDADVTTADEASGQLRSYIESLMEHEIIRTKNSQAEYVGFDRPFGDRPTYGGVGGGGGVVFSTSDKSGAPGSDSGMTVVGKTLLSVFSVLGVLLAFLALKKRRSNRQESEAVDAALAPAPEPEKPLEISRSGSEATLAEDLDHCVDMDFSEPTADAQAEAEAAMILEDIQRTRSTSVGSPSGKKSPLPVVHEDFDPSFESEV